MSRACPLGHKAEHVAVEVPLVPGRAFRVVHRCTEPHTLSDCHTAPFRDYAGRWVQDREEGFSFVWVETARDAAAVADMARQALQDMEART